MLRPATPLTIALAAAFGLLLISVISAPITKSIYLGKADDTIFGVFGRCTGDQCSKVGLGYDDVTADGPSKFHLADSVRKTLSMVLILHPIAAGLTLIVFVMAAASHIRSAAHSSRYLLILFIFIFLACLIAIVAFVIDIVLFLPHMAFGTYLVLAAAILLAISTVAAFARRRSIISRRSRQRQIAENAEMSGENYYNRAAHAKPIATFATVPHPAVAVSGANGGADGLPTFASYESSRAKDDQVSDERIPLTQVRTADRSPGTNASDPAYSSPSRSASRDRYGNQPNGTGDAYGAQGQPYGSNGRPRGGMSGYRGGGAPRGGRGGYYPPTRGRGGYGPPGRGGMGPRGRGGGPYGQSRDGYGGPAMTGAAMAGGAVAGAATGRGGRQGYDTRPAPETYDAYNNQPTNRQGEYGWGSQSNPGYPSAEANLPRAESPPPLPADAPAVAGFGLAVEMGPQEGSHHGYGVPHPNTIRDNDSDVAGMVQMQQGHPTGQPRPGYMSDGSKYSTDEYVPPRAAWNQGSGRRSPRGQSPVYGAERRSPAVDYRGPSSPLAAGPTTTGGYYEDVEPQYATAGPHPASITSPTEPFYEDVHAMDGARSPAMSEHSNFTSVSQRGVNPRWNPHQHPMPQSNIGRRAVHVQQRQDILLDNPDFQLAGGRVGKPKHGGAGGMVPGSAYPDGAI